MAISNVSLTDTFGTWLTGTNQLIVAVNDLTGQGTTIRNVTLGLVNANSVLIGTVNVGSTLGLAFDKANSANVQATSAYARANVANTTANTSLLYANLAFDKANSTLTIANLAFDQANIGLSAAQGAFGKANTINVSTNFSGNVSTANANVSQQFLSDSSGTISWNTAIGQIATVTLTGTGRTMLAPTSLKVGTYILHVIQDGSGARTITTWNSVFKWTAGVAPTLTTDANARDVFSFISDGTNLYGSFLPDVR